MAVNITWETAHTACSSKEFADKLAAGGSYPSLEACIAAAQRIWWNEVDVQGWLEAFAAHPEIGDAGKGSIGRYSIKQLYVLNGYLIVTGTMSASGSTLGRCHVTPYTACAAGLTYVAGLGTLVLEMTLDQQYLQHIKDIKNAFQQLACLVWLF
jgi:hypothetical protein